MPKFFRTSNATKLAEFKRFGLDLLPQAGPDLAEVDGTPEEVVIYKALAAGESVLVEDTSLDVDGCEAGVNIKWLLDEVLDQMRLDPAGMLRKATWRVMVAYFEGGFMHLAGSEVRGTLTPNPRGKGFSFDAYFIPDGQNLTLGELEILGLKDMYSARKAAAAIIAGSSHKIIPLHDIPEWKGAYQ